eukprot:m.36530 g.36530  ORF g.36530 m.36530 type:complete len:238 (+) comp11429_c0_seq1:80-793(+)
MSKPILYTYPQNPRAWKILIAALYSGVDLDVKDSVPEFKLGVSNKTPDFLARFPFGKVPALITADGQPIYESNAIAFFVASYGGKLLPSDPYQLALVHQFVNLADHEVYPAACTWVYPTFGIIQYNKSATEKAKADVRRILEALDTTLAEHKYLVADTITLADVTLVCTLVQLFVHVLDPEFRKPFSHVNKWFLDCVSQPQFKKVLKDVKLCEVAAVPDEAAYERLVKRSQNTRSER